MKTNNVLVRRVPLTMVAYLQVQVRLAGALPNWKETLKEVGHNPTPEECMMHWATSVRAVIFAQTYRIVNRAH